MFATSLRTTVSSMLVMSKRCRLRWTDSQQPEITLHGLTINIKKTEVMSQQVPGNQYQRMLIKVNGQILQAVENFNYLSNTLSRSANVDFQINSRICKALSSPFRRLQKKVWDRNGISLKTKSKVSRGQIFSRPHSRLPEAHATVEPLPPRTPL